MQGYIQGDEIIIETRGRKPINRYELIDEDTETFIAWVEGRYTPRTQAEEYEFYRYAEKCFPHLYDQLI